MKFIVDRSDLALGLDSGGRAPVMRQSRTLLGGQS